ncbi:Translation initiation factor IF-3, N-terminal domain protein [Acididesulfobacillus acetoxydans]|uniref:Translation initiation factor IF-3 n=1 Tax=Acididesulfobacillus acetoxydans TaxID=1561005 RepID=A0A8S0XAJ7_9FIRM|nr:Translation initiation factor IF-3, N-terminal domain protein [Acididesulfobacillus acetoxydans]CEJ07952.1 Translation initiation factor IF-3 [Acididesulfobacillus acetoxydans]
MRLVGEGGEQLGIMQVRDALHLAMEKSVDLVEIAPTAKPPVCKLMDYGKYKYEQAKRDKETRKKHKTMEIKEVKLRPNIEDHDFETKARNAQRFLGEGDKVKVTIMFRGREITHPEQGRILCLRLAEFLKTEAVIERDPKLEGRNMVMILAAVKPQVQQVSQVQPTQQAPQAQPTRQAPQVQPTRQPR